MSVYESLDGKGIGHQEKPQMVIADNHPILSHFLKIDY